MEMQLCIKCNKTFEVTETEKHWKKMCKECYTPKNPTQEVKKVEIKQNNDLDIGKNPDAAFGSVFGHAITLAVHTVENSQGLTNFDEAFNKSFDLLWSLMVKKRREVLK